MYYSATIGILGKMYSNAMMIVLNSRIVLQAQYESVMLNDPVSFAESNLNFSNVSLSDSPSGISVMRETVDSSGA